MRRQTIAGTLVLLLAACGGSDDGNGAGDAGDASDVRADGGDTGGSDAGDTDAGDTDAGGTDAGGTDADADGSDAGGDATDPDATDAAGDADDTDSTDPDATDAGGDTADDTDAADAGPPVCDDGYRLGSDGSECVDIDECDEGTDDCDALVTCTNSDGSFVCGACPDGYRDPEGDGTLCININECEEEIDDCDPLAGCFDTDGAYDCGTCPGGYRDPEGDGTLCVDIDECEEAIDDCDPLVSCTDTDGGYDCGPCPGGYRDPAGDGTLCIDIDECEEAIDDCDPLVSCTDTDGAFDCGECPLGYEDVRGDGALCRSRFATAPDAPQCYIWGTGHIRTFDGLAYDLQGAGEWQIVHDPADPGHAVQVRQEPLPDNGLAAQVTAVAVRVDTSRVVVTAGSPVTIAIDGTPAEPGDSGIALPGASLHDVDGVLVVAWESGDQVRVVPVGERLDVAVYPAAGREGRLRGLCGDADGVPVNDVRPAGGEPVLPPIDVADLYAIFVHGWAVDDLTSAFDYPDGIGRADFFDAAFPTGYVEATDLPDEERALYAPDCEAAELGHPFLVEACILDAYWGDLTEAIDAGLRVDDPEVILPLSKPLLFGNWRQQGPLANGTWNVALDFASVFQTINGDPTFFVSPNSYQNVEIAGTIRVETTGDDDLVGFVFGFRAPLREEGMPDRVFDTWLLDWKQLEQTFDGLFCAEGYALSRVTGDFAAGWGPWWGRTTEPRWTTVATRYGSTEGWGDNVLNTFRLLQTPHRVDIWMNDVLIFREVGEFQSGRFGFYNYSQPSVRYANFRVTDIDAAALCGDGFVDVGEACDDGNDDETDGCLSTCEVP